MADDRPQFRVILRIIEPVIPVPLTGALTGLPLVEGGDSPVRSAHRADVQELRRERGWLHRGRLVVLDVGRGCGDRRTALPPGAGERVDGPALRCGGGRWRDACGMGGWVRVRRFADLQFVLWTGRNLKPAAWLAIGCRRRLLIWASPTSARRCRCWRQRWQGLYGR